MLLPLGFVCVHTHTVNVEQNECFYHWDLYVCMHTLAVNVEQNECFYHCSVSS